MDTRNVPEPEEAKIFQPDDDGQVSDLPGEENVYPNPNAGGLPDGTVVLAQLSEQEGNPATVEEAIRAEGAFDDARLAEGGRRSHRDER